MYDYATVTKQNQIIQEIQETNENLEKIEISIKEAGLLIGMLIGIIIVEKFVKVLIGGRW